MFAAVLVRFPSSSGSIAVAVMHTCIHLCMYVCMYVYVCMFSGGSRSSSASQVSW